MCFVPSALLIPLRIRHVRRPRVTRWDYVLRDRKPLSCRQRPKKNFPDASIFVGAIAGAWLTERRGERRQVRGVHYHSARIARSNTREDDHASIAYR